MIRLGLRNAAKHEIVADYARREQISKIVTFSPPRFRLGLDPGCPWEQVDWDEVIMYRTFYRLLQEIDSTTLLVINECLRTPNRAELTYNCLRNYLTRTEHQIVFNCFPAIESPNDFMILADLDTRSRWRRSKLSEAGEMFDVEFADVAPAVTAIEIETDAKTRAQYAKKKRSLIDGIGSKDPHTIPRQLHLLAGKHKAREAGDRGGLWVGRNARLKVDEFATYGEATEPRQVLEFCHSYREWSDYLTASGALEVPALVSDLKVDRWYLERFQTWTEMQRDAYAAIRDHLSS
jgi:hypothetical protein